MAFEAGAEAYEAGRFTEALAQYERAYQLSGRPKLLFNIARAADGDAQPERALDAYQTYLLALPQAPNLKFVESRIAKLNAAIANGRAPGPTIEREQFSSSTSRRLSAWGASDESWYRRNRRFARAGGWVALVGVVTIAAGVPLLSPDSAKLGAFVLGFLTFGAGQAMVAAANLRGAKEMRRRGLPVSKVTGILGVVGVFMPPLLWVAAPMQSARLREAHEQVAPAQRRSLGWPSGLTLRVAF